MKYFKRIDWPLTVVLVSVVIALILTVRANMQETKRWNKFKMDHNCKIVEVREPSSNIVIVVGETAGTGVVEEAGSVTWLCDDGVKYTRRK